MTDTTQPSPSMLSSADNDKLAALLEQRRQRWLSAETFEGLQAADVECLREMMMVLLAAWIREQLIDATASSQSDEDRQIDNRTKKGRH